MRQKAITHAVINNYVTDKNRELGVEEIQISSVFETLKSPTGSVEQKNLVLFGFHSPFIPVKSSKSQVM